MKKWLLSTAALYILIAGSLPAMAQTNNPSQTASEGSEVYFKNCTAARAAGAAPIRAGEPGYSRKLDRDGDGVACE
ncbi:excalibur calcium-binding domain-containing protein [Sinorhizobium meliloti]|uniref:excalibur calcium-binding domain-containing protein n=1 Tax=Rhizobium meliloti TaxID=382 RepID=UPI001295D0FE|nr:excalibur calcium-binding domain-containing protein [Sinorhizobium meliloti]MDW9393089.1 calcium-binding protein [Sinorhizobium meliloti]MDW9436975.1 calcium-binding protein [Sinorhizobium meliloti]MDW9478579.1 calcium-binding protein [Sinorhizobium meliloti]MDW9591963.1 calcium-binding protein [Sinorhizobium meliloti]MDW9618609.1 calcium-binding protein [Sinorhizobium meliloti]